MGLSQFKLSLIICATFIEVTSELYICKVHLLLYLENPSCLHATFASTALQRSSHTVPHCLFKQTSTRPWYGNDV